MQHQFLQKLLANVHFIKFILMPVCFNVEVMITIIFLVLTKGLVLFSEENQVQS